MGTEHDVHRVATQEDAPASYARAGRVQRMLMLLCTCCAVAVGAAVMAPAAWAGHGYQVHGEFGTPGTGPGELDNPQGVAAYETATPLLASLVNDVYVGDSGRVQRFGPNGEYESEFETVTPGGKIGTAILAVDDSTEPLDPSAGDIYIIPEEDEHGRVYRFTPTGEYAGEIVGTCAEPGTCPGAEIPFGAPSGLAVDGSGNFWVVDSQKDTVDEFGADGAFIRSFATGMTEPQGIAVNTLGDVYVIGYAERAREVPEFTEFTEAGQKVTDVTLGTLTGGAKQIAIDPATGNLFVVRDESNDGEIDEYSVSGELLESVEIPELNSGHPQLAIDGSDGSTPETASIYVPIEREDKIDIVRYVELPEVTTGAASEQTETSALLHGTVNPSGQPINGCAFEYGTTTGYGLSVPCEQSPAAIGYGTQPVNVTARVSGLTADTLYHYRLTASNEAFGTEPGGDATFGPAQLGKPTVSEVGEGTATVSLAIDPEGSETSYEVEYGTSEAYGSATAAKSAGAGDEAVDVAVHLSGLQPQTGYHLRVEAKNGSGTSLSADASFSTAATVSSQANSLPDGRVYELVTRPEGATGEAYAPYAEMHESEEPSLTTEEPYEAAADGDALVYAGAPSVGGNGNGGEGGGNAYRAVRGADGWEASSIQPPGLLTPVYQAFSSELTVGFLGSLQPLSAGLPEAFGSTTTTGYMDVYEHAFGAESYAPLFDTVPLNRDREEFLSIGVRSSGLEAPSEKAEVLGYGGSSTSMEHVVFEADDALIEGSGKVEKELDKDAKAEFEDHERGDYVYDSVDGQLSLVDVLPSGLVAPKAALGGEGNDFSHDISSDGSRIFWTDLTSGQVYVRENDATTVEVSAGAARARYWTATPDGRYAYYTEGGQLWRFDSEAEAGADREALTPEGAGVEGVIGTNETGEDGAYVYFVAAGDLASEANSAGAEPIEGQPNVYVLHDGRTAFIATITAQDESYGRSPDGVAENEGDLEGYLGERTAEPSRNGESVVFMSQSSLTGYDNENMREVYVYDAPTGELTCASCAPAGTPPVNLEEGEPHEPLGSEFTHARAAFLPVSFSATYVDRWISADGSRVFFDSLEPLVPQDRNGKMDVYEWERDGAGSCEQSGGCVFLLSSGTSSDASYLIDASESGDDVFIATRSQLTEEDEGGRLEIYDARVNGARPVSPPQCSGSGCQGVPAAPPVFATPASETFAGIGNFPAAPTKKATKKKGSAKPTRAQKLAKALTACKSKKPKRKRAACKASARRKYAKTSQKKTGGKAKRKATSRRGA